MSERNRLLLFQHSYAPSRITKQGGIHQKVLTGYFQRGISANGLSKVIAGNTSVNTLVGFAAASVDDAQEKKGAAWQQHAVGTGVVLISFNVLAVFIPLHRGRGPTLRLAVQGGRLTLRHDQIRGILHYPGGSILQTWTGPCKESTVTVKSIYILYI